MSRVHNQQNYSKFDRKKRSQPSTQVAAWHSDQLLITSQNSPIAPRQGKLPSSDTQYQLMAQHYGVREKNRSRSRGNRQVIIGSNFKPSYRHRCVSSHYVYPREGCFRAGVIPSQTNNESPSECHNMAVSGGPTKRGLPVTCRRKLRSNFEISARSPSPPRSTG